MTTIDTIQELLATFDRLSPIDQALVAKEISKRVAAGDDDATFEQELTVLADQVFQMYDREEEEQNGSTGSASR